ncbi:MAG: Hint domain-containing protein [Nanoarchaeota archaeon]
MYRDKDYLKMLAVLAVLMLLASPLVHGADELKDSESGGESTSEVPEDYESISAEDLAAITDPTLWKEMLDGANDPGFYEKVPSQMWGQIDQASLDDVTAIPDEHLDAEAIYAAGRFDDLSAQQITYQLSRGNLDGKDLSEASIPKVQSALQSTFGESIALGFGSDADFAFSVSGGRIQYGDNSYDPNEFSDYDQLIDAQGNLILTPKGSSETLTLEETGDIILDEDGDITFSEPGAGITVQDTQGETLRYSWNGEGTFGIDASGEIFFDDAEVTVSELRSMPGYAGNSIIQQLVSAGYAEGSQKLRQAIADMHKDELAALYPGEFGGEYAFTAEQNLALVEFLNGRELYMPIQKVSGSGRTIATDDGPAFLLDTPSGSQTALDDYRYDAQIKTVGEAQPLFVTDGEIPEELDTFTSGEIRVREHEMFANGNFDARLGGFTAQSKGDEPANNRVQYDVDPADGSTSIAAQGDLYVNDGEVYFEGNQESAFFGYSKTPDAESVQITSEEEGSIGEYGFYVETTDLTSENFFEGEKKGVSLDVISEDGEVSVENIQGMSSFAESLHDGGAILLDKSLSVKLGGQAGDIGCTADNACFTITTDRGMTYSEPGSPTRIIVNPGTVQSFMGAGDTELARANALAQKIMAGDFMQETLAENKELFLESINRLKDNDQTEGLAEVMRFNYAITSSDPQVMARYISPSDLERFMGADRETQYAMFIDEWSESLSTEMADNPDQAFAALNTVADQVFAENPGLGMQFLDQAGDLDISLGSAQDLRDKKELYATEFTLAVAEQASAQSLAEIEAYLDYEGDWQLQGFEEGKVSSAAAEVIKFLSVSDNVREWNEENVRAELAELERASGDVTETMRNLNAHEQGISVEDAQTYVRVSMLKDDIQRMIDEGQAQNTREAIARLTHDDRMAAGDTSRPWYLDADVDAVIQRVDQLEEQGVLDTSDFSEEHAVFLTQNPTITQSIQAQRDGTDPQDMDAILASYSESAAEGQGFIQEHEGKYFAADLAFGTLTGAAGGAAGLLSKAPAAVSRSIKIGLGATGAAVGTAVGLEQDSVMAGLMAGSTIMGADLGLAASTTARSTTRTAHRWYDMLDYTGPTGCFVEGTLITMADKSKKAIEDVKEGDMVLAYDVEEGRAVEAAVLDVLIEESDHLVHINDRITATGDHPFYIVNRHAFIAAEDIREGDVIKTARGTMIVTSVVHEYLEEKITVYNLDTDDRYDTFFAEEMLVHNDCSEIIRRSNDLTNVRSRVAEHITRNNAGIAEISQQTGRSMSYTAADSISKELGSNAPVISVRGAEGAEIVGGDLMRQYEKSGGSGVIARDAGTTTVNTGSGTEVHQVVQIVDRKSNTVLANLDIAPGTSTSGGSLSDVALDTAPEFGNSIVENSQNPSNTLDGMANWIGNQLHLSDEATTTTGQRLSRSIREELNLGTRTDLSQAELEAYRSALNRRVSDLWEEAGTHGSSNTGIATGQSRQNVMRMNIRNTVERFNNANN